MKLLTLLGLLLVVSQAEAAGGHSTLVQTRVPPMSVRLVQTPRALPAEEIWIKAFVNGARLEERVTGRTSEEFSGQGVIVSVRMPSRAPALVRIASVRRTGARVRVIFWWKAKESAMAYRPPIASGRPFSSPEAVSRAALERQALIQALARRLAQILSLLDAGSPGRAGVVEASSRFFPPPRAPAPSLLPPEVTHPAGVSPGPLDPGRSMPASGNRGRWQQPGVWPGLWNWIGQPGFYESDYDPHGRRMGGPGPGLY